jgi:hypothetical protein
MFEIYVKSSSSLDNHTVFIVYIIYILSDIFINILLSKTASAHFFGLTFVKMNYVHTRILWQCLFTNGLVEKNHNMAIKFTY